MARRRQLFWTLAFVAALAFTALFTVRAVQHRPHLRGEADEPIRPWMNVRYISHVYGVPPEVLYEALHLPPHQRDPRPLGHIARQQGRPVNAVIADVEAAITNFGAPEPPPPPSPPAIPTMPSLSPSPALRSVP